MPLGKVYDGIIHENEHRQKHLAETSVLMTQVFYWDNDVMDIVTNNRFELEMDSLHEEADMSVKSKLYTTNGLELHDIK